MAEVVAGLDGFKSKWVAVVLEDGRFREALLFDSLAKACKVLGSATQIAVDAPIGFPTAPAGRRAEQEARKMVGPRASSVFPTLPEDVYLCDDQRKAASVAERLTGKRIGSQSFAMRSKIMEANRAAKEDKRLFEVHPEVCFRAMAKEMLAWSKKTWNGQLLRCQLLAKQRVVLPRGDLGAAGEAGPDDVLDAAAAAWTAWRKARGLAEHLPKEPSDDDEGLIWY